MRITYIIDLTYNEVDTLSIASKLFKIFIKTMVSLKKEIKEKLQENDLIYYPISPTKINKGRKLIVEAKSRAKGILEYIDEKFMKEVEKEQLKIQREVVENESL